LPCSLPLVIPAVNRIESSLNCKRSHLERSSWMIHRRNPAWPGGLPMTYKGSRTAGEKADANGVAEFVLMRQSTPIAILPAQNTFHHGGGTDNKSACPDHQSSYRTTEECKADPRRSLSSPAVTDNVTCSPDPTLSQFVSVFQLGAGNTGSGLFFRDKYEFRSVN
jgi:hypothetical protein